jgi:integrase/recombinase XerD
MAKRGRVYNRIYSDEKWAQVNPGNKAIMEDYLAELTQRQKKKTTIDQYRNDLRIVMIYILEQKENRLVLELTKKDFRGLSLWYSNQLECSNARVNRILSALRSMLSYVEDDDDYDYDMNAASKVKGLPSDPVKTDEDAFFLSYDEIAEIRQMLIDKEELQLAVLHMILFDSGGRRNEVFQIEKHGLLDGNKTNVVEGKRGKMFPLVYLDDTKELIKRYLEWRGDDDINSLWVDIGPSGKSELKSSQTLYNWIVKIAKMYSEYKGKEYSFFPHSYRHSRSESLRQGTDPRLGYRKFSLEEVQLFLHHSDPKTTQGYLKDHSEEQINEMFGFEKK